ncbi:MAG TPA: DUF5667 domain-containing protein [Micromonosporaceae bacterium]|nr:DUF5667 domain-containing protein [Micromonosporaceae bacterium]
MPALNRRRAERLAVLLDEAAGGRRHRRRTDLDEELGDLVRLAGRIAEVPGPKPDPEFRAHLRRLLLATIQREGIGATAVAKAEEAARRAALEGETQTVDPVPARTRRTRAAVLTGVTVGALALSGVSAASTNSLPGEALYPLKITAEKAQLALAGSEEGRGELYLKFAADRLDEAGRVRSGASGLLREMDEATRAGVQRITSVAVRNNDPSHLAAITRFVDRQRAGLGKLHLPSREEEVRLASLALLDSVQVRVELLHRALAGECQYHPEPDTLGPVPRCE